MNRRHRDQIHGCPRQPRFFSGDRAIPDPRVPVCLRELLHVVICCHDSRKVVNKSERCYGLEILGGAIPPQTSSLAQLRELGDHPGTNVGKRHQATFKPSVCSSSPEPRDAIA